MKKLSAANRKERAKRADQNELFKRALNLLSDAVLLVDRKNKIIFINSQAPVLFGLPRHAILGKPLDRILILEDRQTRLRLDKPPSLSNGPVALTGAVGDSSFNVTAIDIHRTAGFNKLKSRALVGLFIHPSDVALASSAANVHQNIIGQLTIRIAHDFNNQLTSMLGNAELVQEALEVINSQENNSPETPAGHAIQINRDVVRKCLEMATAIRNLQDYARQEPTARRELDLNTTISGTLAMGQRIVGSRLVIDFAPAQNLPAITADQTQIHHLLFTIFDNCKERAGSGRGTIAVKTTRVALDEHFASTHPGARAGEHLKLQIADRGELLPLDSLPKAINLFASDRQSNALRLATAYPIVKQLGAYIDIESDQTNGTRFQIYFPLTDVPEPTFRSPKRNRRGSRVRRAIKEAATKPCLILIAEDLPDIRQTMVRYLTKAGYQTEVAATGPDALARFKILNGNGHKPSLVIADLGLPGMDGRMLCKKIQSINSHVAVLLTSGHAIQLDSTGTHTVDGIPFIPKPFDTTTLLKRIRALLKN